MVTPGHLERDGAYERPATFQAAAIVMVEYGLTGWWVGLRVADRVGGVELKVADAARSCSSAKHVTVIRIHRCLRTLETFTQIPR